MRFIGDRVAAVAAETREAAEIAAREIVVNYDVLPAVLDTAAALAPGAPALHPGFDDYSYPVYATRPRPQRSHPNIQGTLLRVKGAADLDPIFAAAHRVFEHRYETPRTHAGYIEPRATLVWIDRAGVVHVHSPNKSPFDLRKQMARTLGLPLEQITVECTSIGGDFRRQRASRSMNSPATSWRKHLAGRCVTSSAMRTSCVRAPHAIRRR